MPQIDKKADAQYQQGYATPTVFVATESLLLLIVMSGISTTVIFYHHPSLAHRPLQFHAYLPQLFRKCAPCSGCLRSIYRS